jgi:hypothetical protein
MSDISNQLIKDSYNYVLQSDISTGVVYRIGGSIPVNPIFQSGLTIQQSFNFSDGTEGFGYVLTSDALGNATWQPVSAATPTSGVTSITVGNGLSASTSTGAVFIEFTGSTGISGEYLPLSGGTVSGSTRFTNGLIANTISATTYYNLPTDVFVTGGTYSNGVTTFRNNTGGTFTIAGFYTGGTDVFVTGATYSNNNFTYTNNTGGTFSVLFNTVTGLTINGNLNVTGNTTFNSLTTNTISATTYYNLPTDVFVTGGTYSNGTTTFRNNTGGTFSVSGFSTGTTVSGLYLPLSGGTLTGGLVANSGVTASTISQTTYIDFTTGSTNPSAIGGRVFFDNTSKALSYYDIIGNNVPIAMGQQLYTRVWNATGAQIDKGKVVSITGTSNGLPSAILSVNTHVITSQRPIGLAAENIPNNSEGLVLNNGILSGITLNTFANGDVLYLSDTIPGLYVNSTASLAFTARTNEIGYVLQTGSTTGKIYVNINNEDSNLSLTDIERNILEGNVISTGAYEYSGATVASTTTINVSKLRGWIVRNTYTYATLPDVTNVYYTGGTNIPLTYLNSADATYILINSGSTLFQQTTFPTPQQRRENIFIGKVVHPNKSTITSINQTVDFDVSPMSAIRDLWTPLKLINQGVVVSSHSTTLEINTSAGTLWGNGIGWTTNQQNPDSISISGTSPTTFQYRSRLGPITGGTAPYTGNTTFIDPANYDNNGVISSVGGGSSSSTNQRVYLFPTGLIRIQYGQQVYSNLAAAVAGSQTEQFVEYGNNRDNGVLIGIISVNKNATNLSNIAQAVFNFVSKFGEIMGGTGGLSTTTLQQAYDNSSTPEIILNATLDGLSLQNGTGNPDNTTRVLEGVNAANSTTSYILADGGFSGSSFSGNSLHISGSSNPVIFKGLTANTSDSNVLSIDSNGNVHTYPISSISGGSSSTSGAYLPLSGGTVTGGTIFTNGLTANTISATTYYNLPIDIRVTGGTYNGGNITFTNNTGGTFNVTGITVTSGYSSNYYASFSNNSNLLLSGANTATVWTYDTTEISNGIEIQNNSQIRVNNTGVYQFGYSPQVEKTQGPDATITIWAAINGTPVARSSSTLKLVSNSVLTLPYVALIFQMNANDYLEFYFSSDNQYVQLTSLSGLTTPTRPNSPALIVDVKQIGNAVSNTLTGSYLPLSGGTVTGATNFTNGLTANTISATTYFNLPTDIRVTGGTYSNGNATFTNNTGGTFNVTGFYTGGTDVFVTGGTYSNGSATFTNNTGGTFSVTGFSTSATFTGGTVSGATNFTNGLTANTISATTYFNLPVTADTFVTGATYSNNTFTFRNNTGGTFNVLFNQMTGLTATTISATTYQNLPVTADTFVTGFTFTSSTNTLTIAQNQGRTNLTTTITTTPLSGVMSAITFNIATTGSITASTISATTITPTTLRANTISATTYQNLPTDIRVTGGTKSGNNVTFTNNTGGTFTVSGFSDTFVTGGTKSGNNVTFTNNTGGTFTVSGFSDTFVTGGTYTDTTGILGFRNNTGGTFNVVGGFNYVTGGTYDGGTQSLSLYTNTGQTISIGGFPTQVGPAGADTEVQLNVGGSFGTNTYFAYNYNGINLIGAAYLGSIDSNVTNSALIAGESNLISTTSYNSGIFAGFDSEISNTSFNSAVLAGEKNVLTNGSIKSLILGGDSNTIDGGTNSLILGGSGNNIVSPINVILLGTNSIASISNDTTYVSNFNINISPTNNDSNTQILTRNSTSGNIEYKDVTSFTDTYVTGATYANNTFTYTNNANNSFSVLFNTITGLTINGNLTVTGNTISPTHSGTTFLSRGTYGTATLNASNNPSMLAFSGSNTIGGTGYTDFIKVTNTAAGAININKTFRLTNLGNLEIVNSAYSAIPLILSDAGNLILAGSVTPNAWTAGQVIKEVMLSNTEVTISTTTIATSTSDTDFLTYSYTPVSSSSYLIIHYHLASFSFASGTGNDSYFSRIKVDGTEITYSYQSTVNGNRSGVLFPLTGRYTNSSTTAKSIVVACRRDSADDSITIVNTATSMWLRITEIAR